MSQSSQENKHRRFSKRAMLIALIAVVLVCRALLPIWATRYLNQKMESMGPYQGSVADVDLKIWRGAYAVNDFRVIDKRGEFDLPLARVPRVEISLSWKSLWKKRIVGTATIKQANLNFVDGPSMNLTGLGVDWKQRLGELIPFRLNEIHVNDASARFHNFSSEPPVDLGLTEIYALVTNVSNVNLEEDTRPASLELTATAFGDANVEADGRFDPLRLLRDFDLRVKLDKFELTRLNDFFRAYANVDIADGSGQVVAELEAAQGQLKGYVKPILTNVDIFSWKQDVNRQGDNPFRLLWEAVAGGIQALFQNQSEDQFASRIEIAGSLDEAEADVMQVIGSILYNAFVDAYKPVFEDQTK